MARILRLSPYQRNILACIALFIVINILVVSEYIVPRRVALSLEDIYDPPSSISPNSTTSTSNISKPRPKILLVSALFSFPNASSTTSIPKPKGHHIPSLSSFLGRITTDLYVFTTLELAPTIRAARGSELPLTVDTSYDTPFDVPPLRGREAVYRLALSGSGSGSGGKNGAGRGARGQAYVPPEVYAERNARPFFLEKAVESVKREYDFVFWIDALGFGGGDEGEEEEGHLYSEWPDPGRVQRVWEEGRKLAGLEGREDGEEELLFVPMVDVPSKGVREWEVDLGPVEGKFAQASFFGGPPVSIKWFARTFYAYHDYFLKLGYASTVTSASSTSTNPILNALLVAYPQRFMTVWPGDPEAPARGGLPPAFLGLGGGYLGECGREKEGYYKWWLAGRETREKMRVLWMGRGSGSDKITAEGWWDWSWRVRTPCRLTRVLKVEGVLKRSGVFGEGWTPRGGSMTVSVSALKPSRTW